MPNLYFAGIDAGSTYIKAALIKDDSIVDVAIANTGIDNSKIATNLLNTLLTSNSINRDDVKNIIATGYSRKIIDIANDDISEIMAHAYGTKLTAPKDYMPGILIDIGGQDCKVIYLDDNYNVVNFTMNDKCAAGTGKFLETSAQILETSIDQIGPLSLESKEPCDINSTCVVFAQTELISLIARKYDRRDILYGMHLAMARRVIKMINHDKFKGDIMLTGGGALNVGLKRAFEEELLKDIFVSNHSQYNGAIGAARFAKEQYME